MKIYSKTYSPAPDTTIKFDFHYDDAIADNFNFDIIEISELETGYDGDDELAIYPGNIKITIEDYSRSAFLKIKSLYDKYVNIPPFNFKSVFFVKIYLNNSAASIFTGKLDTDIDDWNKQELTLTFTNAVNLIKNVDVRNPNILNKFCEKKCAKWNVINVEILNGNKYLWGLGSIDWSIASNGSYTITGVTMDDEVLSLYTDAIFTKFLDAMFESFNKDIVKQIIPTIKFQNTGGTTPTIGGIASLRLPGIKPVYDMFGRYMIIQSEFSIRFNNIADHFDYISTYKFQDGRGNLKDYQLWCWKSGHGYAEELNAGELLKLIARSFFSRVIFYSFDLAAITDKVSNVMTIDNITSRLISVKRELIAPPPEYVRAEHYKRYSAGEKGTKSIDPSLNTTIQQLFETSYNWDNTGNLHIVNPSNLALHLQIDAVNFGQGWIQNRLTQGIAEKEYEFLRKKIFKFTIEAFGKVEIQNKICITYNSELIYLLPIKITYDLIRDKSTITAISIQ